MAVRSIRPQVFDDLAEAPHQVSKRFRGAAPAAYTRAVLPALRECLGRWSLFPPGWLLTYAYGTVLSWSGYEGEAHLAVRASGLDTEPHTGVFTRAVLSHTINKTVDPPNWSPSLLQLAGWRFADGETRADARRRMLAVAADLIDEHLDHVETAATGMDFGKDADDRVYAWLARRIVPVSPNGSDTDTALTIGLDEPEPIDETVVSRATAALARRIGLPLRGAARGRLSDSDLAARAR